MEELCALKECGVKDTRFVAYLFRTMDTHYTITTKYQKMSEEPFKWYPMFLSAQRHLEPKHAALFSLLALFAVLLLSPSQSLRFPPFVLGQENTSVSTEVVTDDAAKVEPIHVLSEPLLTSRETAWGGFLPGSSSQMRKITYTIQGNKVVKRVTDVVTTLEKIDDNEIVLKEVVSVDLGSKIVGQQSIKYDFYKQRVMQDQNVVVSQLQPESLVIGGRKIVCNVRTYEKTTPQDRWITKVWYNSTLSPYVLQTRTDRVSLPTPQQPTPKVLSQTVSSVVNPPSTTLRGMFLGAYRVKTEKHNTEGTTITYATCNQRIPGGVKCEQIFERDKEGRLMSKTEVILTGCSVIRPELDETP